MTTRIGIDVGTRTGIAVVDCGVEFRARELWTVDYQLAAPLALGLALFYSCDVVIEEPQVSHVYQREGQGAGAMRKIALNVGECRQRALRLRDEVGKALMRWSIQGVAVHMRPPVKGGTKWPREVFNERFQWTGASSSHSRDAAVIAMQGEA